MAREAPLPPNFDWVSVRSKCSAIEMFEVLRGAAQENTLARNRTFGVEGTDGDVPFGFTQHGERSFSVWSRRGPGRQAVDFYLSPNGDTFEVNTISAAREVVTLTLTDEAVCKLKIGDDTLDPWQVLRRFLEPLFFRA